ncbi:MAG: hypothetical protein KHW81_15860 [[Clostridium] innocuum]|nr:hypothetical protein [[Clostridium] innocuum]MBS5685847.1 hypothetical protein [[Clostridium] innocuum]
MSRRDEYLRKQQEQQAVEKVSRIYLATITEVLHDAKLKKDDIEYLLSEVTEKIENLSTGYIGLDDYIEFVEEKTGIKLHED